MATISSYSDDHWALSEDVNDKIDVTTRGDPVDVETDIEEATDLVQGWWHGATGLDVPEDLPGATTLQEGGENDRLSKATAYLAASLRHEKLTENVRSTRTTTEEDSEDQQRKYVFLERRAEQFFDSWVAISGYDEPGSGGDGDSGVGTPGVGEGRIDALIDLPDR